MLLLSQIFAERPPRGKTFLVSHVLFLVRPDDFSTGTWCSHESVSLDTVNQALSATAVEPQSRTSSTDLLNRPLGAEILWPDQEDHTRYELKSMT
jgi:hypothetical protein